MNTSILLGQLRERRHAFPVLAPLEEDRLGGCIVIPEVVAHMLEMPAHLAVVKINRDNTVRVEAVAGPPGAIVVR